MVSIKIAISDDGNPGSLEKPETLVCLKKDMNDISGGDFLFRDTWKPKSHTS